MHSFQPLQTFTAASPSVLAGISDLLIADLEGGTVLLGITRPGGGLVSLRLDGPAMVLQSTLLVEPTGFLAAPPQLSLQAFGGSPSLMVWGGYHPRISGYHLSAAGDFGAVVTLRGSPSGVMSAVEFATLGATPVHFVARASESLIRTFILGPSARYVELAPVAFGAGGDDRDITALKHISIAGQSHLVALSQTAGEVALFRIDPSGALHRTGGLGASDGIGMAGPVAVELARSGGQDFLIVASAGTSSLTVMQVMGDGSLRLADHAGDTLLTRFQGVQALNVVEAAGWTFVLAGGADDGVTLFVLLPDGRLVKTGQIEQAVGLALEDVSALTARTVAAGLDVFVSGEGIGIGRFRVPLPVMHAPLIGTMAADTLTGGAGADLIFGSGGADALFGEAGADLLADGAGADSLTGGTGGDLFVLSRDGVTDRIEDFEADQDRIDLTGWGRLYTAQDLSITTTATGATIQWQDEVVIVRSALGVGIDPLALRAAVVLDLWRMLPQPIFVDGIWYGTTLAELIRGTAAAETFMASRGPDTIDGGDGQDLVDFQEATGPLHVDLAVPTAAYGWAEGLILLSIEGLAGGAFADVLRGSLSANVLTGGDGNDKLEGRDGDDLLEGGGGDDILAGGAGADRLLGGAGFDKVVYWDSPAGVLVDLLTPDRNTGFAAGDQIAEVEVVWGSFLADALWGDEAPNRLYGDRGADTIVGRGGDDVLFGGDGDDVIVGGAGRDVLNGGDGFDLVAFWDMDGPLILDLARNWAVIGEESDLVLNFEAVFGTVGADVIRGQAVGNALSGGDGNDVIDGRGGADSLFGGAGRDTLMGGEGDDLLTGGAGADHFVFASGQDRITDFDPTEDMLFLDRDLGGGVPSIAAALSFATTDGGGITFDFGSGDLLRLDGTFALSLLAGRMDFV